MVFLYIGQYNFYSALVCSSPLPHGMPNVFLFFLALLRCQGVDLNRTMTLTSVLDSPDIVTSCDRRSEASDDSGSKANLGHILLVDI
jgi:hypothetical protein